MVQKNLAQLMDAATSATDLIDKAVKTGSDYALQCGISNYIEAMTDKVVLVRNMKPEAQDLLTITAYKMNREAFYNDLARIALAV